jgi:two-component system OmpR family response regulator
MDTTGERILIIDDDADYRASLTQLLESEGYVVLCAASAREGLSKIAGESPDLIILDIIMEYDSAGYEVNQAIKFRDEYILRKNIPILMVSSIQSDPATLYSRAAEVAMITPDAYLTKPLDIPAFLAQVKSLLAQRERQAPAQLKASRSNP